MGWERVNGRELYEKEIASRRLCTNYGIPRTFHQTETTGESKGKRRANKKGGLTERYETLAMLFL